MPNKYVVIEYTIRAVQSVPVEWTNEEIEFHRNESSWCCDTFIDEIIERNSKFIDGQCGWCNLVIAKCIGDATENEINEWNVADEIK